MASVTFSPARLCGSAMVPPAKSEAHRALLLAALGRGECRLKGFAPPLCDDTRAMISGISALGANVRHEGTELIVTPGRQHAALTECCVHACAAALRMLIPVFLTRGQAVRFRMDPALFERPLDAFEPLLRSIGASMIRTPAGADGMACVEIRGFLPAGRYEIDGSQSSQFASGMLMALANTPSVLRVTGPIVSRPYLDMTLRMMERFGMPAAEETEGVFTLAASQAHSPETVDVSGDWSQAAVFCCLNAMGSDIRIENLPAAEDCLQGDARIGSILARMTSGAGLKAAEIDCTDIPDLAPMLALTCTQADGVSKLRGVGRLRIKESDRLQVTQELLHALGAHTVLCGGDTLQIHGPAVLHGGFEADAHRDHRMVMLLAAAATLCDAPITVHGAECINKSWPGFWNVYRALGGEAE